MAMARHQRGGHARLRASLAAALALLAAPAVADFATLTGAVSFEAGPGAPPGARVEVSLLDVSRADAPSVRIASILLATEGAAAVAYALRYDARVIDPGHTYAVSAEIRDGARLLYRTTSRHPALTRGAPDVVDVVMARIAPAPGPAGDWRVTAIAGHAMNPDVETTLSVGEDGALSGSGGCNRIRGQATIDGAGFTPGPLAATRMACPRPRAAQELAFLRAMETVRGWRREGRMLVLTDGTGAAALTLAPAG